MLDRRAVGDLRTLTLPASFAGIAAVLTLVISNLGRPIHPFYLVAAILYKLKLNQSVTTIPTVGFNVETVTYKNVKSVCPFLLRPVERSRLAAIAPHYALRLRSALNLDANADNAKLADLMSGYASHHPSDRLT